jgi:hypothetical protein
MKTLYNWLQFSGLSVTIQFNPLHWKMLPWLRREQDFADGPNTWTGCFTFLFLTVRVWIDNGDW